MMGIWAPSDAAFAKLPITTALVHGDSISDQGSSGLNLINAPGYWGQARMFGGSGWDPAVNGSVLEFASGTQTTGQLLTSHLEQMQAAAGETVFDNGGINDAFQSVPLATTLANKATLWNAMRALGKQVIVLPAIPAPLTAAGNGAGAVSARIQAMNEAVEDLAQDFPGVFFINHTRPYHVVPGVFDYMGVAANTSDNLHPNSLGASILGRELHAKLMEAGFVYGKDPRNLGGTIVTPNGDFSAGTTAPTNYSLSPPANAGSVGVHSFYTEGSYKWWRFPLNKGTSTAYWAVNNFQANTVSPANKNHDAIAIMRVVSGTLVNTNLTRYETPFAQAAIDMTGNSLGQITAADGIVVFRTPIRATGGSVTLSYPQLIMQPVADAVVEVAMSCVREFP